MKQLITLLFSLCSLMLTSMETHAQESKGAAFELTASAGTAGLVSDLEDSLIGLDLRLTIDASAMVIAIQHSVAGGLWSGSYKQTSFALGPQIGNPAFTFRPQVGLAHIHFESTSGGIWEPREVELISYVGLIANMEMRVALSKEIGFNLNVSRTFNQHSPFSQMMLGFSYRIGLE